MHRYRLAAYAALALCLACGTALGGMMLGGNLHTIVEGEAYRSAQPTPETLRTYVESLHLKTVLNLRGANPREQWYRDERRLAGELGITMIDFPMSAGERLSPDRAGKLLTLLRDAEKPLLIHCKAGADRTGLVSVLYANQVAGIDEETAEWQLSPFYGHVGIPFLSSTFEMDLSWEDLEAALGIES